MSEATIIGINKEVTESLEYNKRHGDYEQVKKLIKSKSKRQSPVIRAYLKGAMRHFSTDEIGALLPYFEKLPDGLTNKNETRRATYLVEEATRIVVNKINSSNVQNYAAQLQEIELTELKPEHIEDEDSPDDFASPISNVLEMCLNWSRLENLLDDTHRTLRCFAMYEYERAAELAGQTISDLHFFDQHYLDDKEYVLAALDGVLAIGDSE